MVSYNTVLVDSSASYIVPLAWVYASTPAGMQSGLIFMDYYGSNAGLNIYAENGSIYNLLNSSIILPTNAIYDIYTNELLVFGSPYIGSIMVYNLNNGSYTFYGVSSNPIVGGAVANEYALYYAPYNYITFLVDSQSSTFYTTNGSYNTWTYFWTPLSNLSSLVVDSAPILYYFYIGNFYRPTLLFGNIGTYASSGSLFQILYLWSLQQTNTIDVNWGGTPLNINIPSNISYGAGASGSLIEFISYNTQNPSQILLYIGYAQPYSNLSNLNSGWYSSYIVASLPYVPYYTSLVVYNNYTIMAFGSPNTGAYLYLFDYLQGSSYQLGSYVLPYIYLGPLAPNSIYYSLNSGNGTGASLIQLQFDNPAIASVYFNINPIMAGSYVIVYASVYYTDGTPASNLTVNFWYFSNIDNQNQLSGAPFYTTTTNASGIASAYIAFPTLPGTTTTSGFVFVQILYA